MYSVRFRVSHKTKQNIWNQMAPRKQKLRGRKVCENNRLQFLGSRPTWVPVLSTCRAIEPFSKKRLYHYIIYTTFPQKDGRHSHTIPALNSHHVLKHLSAWVCNCFCHCQRSHGWPLSDCRAWQTSHASTAMH